MTPLALAAALTLTWTAAALANDTETEREAHSRQPIAQAPADREARFTLAQSLAWQGRYSEAEAEYIWLLQQQPKNVDYLLGMAQIQLWQARPSAALPLLAQAIQIAPDYEELWRTQIKALLSVGTDKSRQQATDVRETARQRFKNSDWHFSPPDIPTPTLPLAEKNDKRPPQLTWEYALSRESLSHGLPDWKSQQLQGQWTTPEKQKYYAGLRETERYALHDTEILLGANLPITALTSLTLESGLSNTHRVLPNHYLQAHLQQKLTASWLLSAGLRQADFNSGTSQIASAGLDYYQGKEHLAYTLYLGGPKNTAVSPSHRWQWTHYFGDRDWIGLALIRGRESEHTANAFLSSQVRGGNLFGRRALNSAWAINWEAGTIQQGNYYTRRGIRLGLQHTF